MKNANCFGTLDERVKIGKAVESDIVTALRANNLKVREATANQDIHEKIDCWVEWEGAELSTQIKYRETGKDVLFEVFHTFDEFGSPHNRIGRDMKGNCALYVVKMGKTIYMFRLSRAKQVIENLLNLAKISGWNNRSVRLGGSELKLQRDPSDNRTKVCAYIPPESLPHIKLASI